MGFVVAYSKSTGHQQMVPEHFFDQPELCRGLTQEVPDGVVVPGDEQAPQPTTAAPSSPESEKPSDEWTVPQLKSYADEHGVDLGGATTKKPILEAVQAAEPEPENPALNAIGTAHPNNPSTPVTGENKE